MDNKTDQKPMGQVIQSDEARIRNHLGEMVRGTDEEALNAMLDAEADRLCGASRYERSEGHLARAFTPWTTWIAQARRLVHFCAAALVHVLTDVDTYGIFLPGRRRA